MKTRTRNKLADYVRLQVAMLLLADCGEKEVSAFASRHAQKIKSELESDLFRSLAITRDTITRLGVKLIQCESISDIERFERMMNAVVNGQALEVETEEFTQLESQL